MTDVGVLESVAARVVMLMAVFGMVGKIINGLLVRPDWREMGHCALSRSPGGDDSVFY